MNLILMRRLYDTLRKLNSPALAWGILLLPVAGALALAALRIALTLFYGGGAEAFDRRYEAHATEQVERSATQKEAFAFLAEHWRTEQPWQRELLANHGVPEDLCFAEIKLGQDGRGIVMVACNAEDGYTTEGALSSERGDLEDEMRGRALRVIARALRVGESRIAEIGVVGVYQKYSFEPGDEAVYLAALELPPRPSGLDVLLAELDQRLKVIENTAQGRRRPINFR